MTDSANAYAVDQNSPVATYVRFGLWDNAFGAAGAVLNGAAENANLVGSDSRRFYFRVRDPNATTSSVDVNWKTLDQARADDDAPASMVLTLLETAPNSKVFVSKAVMLVTDSGDQSQATDSGLPAPYADVGSRSRGQSNHRIRKGSLRGYVKGGYAPGGGGDSVAVEVPIFRNGGEHRKAVPVQFFVLRVAAGGAAVISTGAGSALWSRDMRVIRETYARIGMRLDTVVAPGTTAANIKSHGGDRVVEIDPPAGVNPANVSFANETAIGTAHPAIANTIRVFFVGGLASGNGGETWTDAIAPVADSRRGAVFTIHGTGPYASAHEIGHAATNKDGTVPADSHFLAPAASPKLRNDQNLMKRQFLGAEGVTGAKRLWDAPDQHNFNQYTAIRGSHYSRSW
ncbi:MAG: hypothetical protein GY778_26690 [bacterium]|nr:hypothetical protein [bacterium]